MMTSDAFASRVRSSCAATLKCCAGGFALTLAVASLSVSTASTNAATLYQGGTASRRLHRWLAVTDGSAPASSSGGRTFETASTAYRATSSGRAWGRPPATSGANRP